MQLVQFNTKDVVCTTGRFGQQGVRLLSASEFKKSRGLKGNEAKREYNTYLRENGKANTGALASAMAEGKLLVRGFSDFKRGLTVRFVKTEAIKDPEEKKEVTAEAACAALGITADQWEQLKGLIKA